MTEMKSYFFTSTKYLVTLKPYTTLISYSVPNIINQFMLLHKNV